MPLDDVRMPRQQMIRGTGLLLTAGTLAACSGGGDKPAASSEAVTTPPSADPPTGGAITKTADVPVGSGVIVGDVVVTQPSAGDFKAFSSKCTHKGCAVNKVADGTIDCPCHGSKFTLDGAVAKGPATEPLEPKTISVQGDSIVLG
ncbi:QcrA and Rieske domain-containing protein [Mycolicibacterium stellerae]|uniref:QcrA and Rieske domain-containing protein n=1 Tax=Mycolicibacterium stellerae TaxID=2358193 RepID=UPI000F0B446D|nr:Rieske (2Fe-2S) protein [Mycolicibacterium stellerae]